MVDILIRDVDKNTARRLKEKAKAKGVSLSEAAREALAAYVGTLAGRARKRPGPRPMPSERRLARCRAIRRKSSASGAITTSLIVEQAGAING